jgi:hypothetical protein
MASRAEIEFHALFESAPVFWRKPVMSWKPEVTTDDRTWNSTGMRFETEKEATDYVADLMLRWHSVRDVRVSACSDPVSFRFIDGALLRVKT